MTTHTYSIRTPVDLNHPITVQGTDAFVHETGALRVLTADHTTAAVFAAGKWASAVRDEPTERGQGKDNLLTP